MKSFNLSEWALQHRSMVWYFMIVAMVAGVFSYLSLGREEDPAFAIRTMVIAAAWPGAAPEEMATQVTERIERELQDLQTLDFTRSTTTAGSTTIFVNLRNETPAATVRQTWLEVRAMVSDIARTFPQGVQGPFFNDRFGDVYGNIYAFTADGLTHRQLRDYVEDARSKILTLKEAGTVELIGAQSEQVYLEFSSRQLAAMGVSAAEVIATLQDQNAISPSGVIQAGAQRVAVRVGGQFSSEESLERVNLRIGDQFFRLVDVASVQRGYTDPPTALFHYNGEPAIGLAIGMRAGGNLLHFGEELTAEVERIVGELPYGVEIHRVSDQPHVVEEAVNGFTKALFEAVGIVLVVCFVSLGLRAGMVVALSIPLVLAITFLFMSYLDISLQRVSLGALIISLGLLVDDAMIAVEMMVSRLEAGDSLKKAAVAVYTSTAFPMLTGTIVTVAGFVPIGLNSSQAGEFTFTLFVVLAIALLVSWVVAVLFTPLIGVSILPKQMKHKAGKKSRAMRAFSALIQGAMRHRWLTIVVTIALFGASLFGMTLVPQQFFPSSDRPELIVEWTLPQNASIAETERQVTKFESDLLAQNPNIDHYSSHIGEGAPRFVLTLDVPVAMPNIAQTVIVTKGLKVRDGVKAEIEAYLQQTFPGTDTYVRRLALGPPVTRPIQYRVSGPDIQTLRTQAQRLAAVISQNPDLGPVRYDWMESMQVVQVDVLEDKARQLGISNSDISTALNGVTSGQPITQIRDNIYLVTVTGRSEATDRGSIEPLQDMQLATGDGRSIPLSSIATLRYEQEQPVINRRDRAPTVTLNADVVGTIQPASVASALAPLVADFAQSLPAGYSVVTGGEVESSEQSITPIVAVVPLMLFIMATVLMIQLQSFSRLILVFAVAPLAVIGVVAALLPFGKPLGFVAILGVLALVGILIRNSVILIVQIEHLRSEGMHAWNAVVDATEHRVRPIILTALAASLGLIPIATEVFWEPMAYAMIGGILVGTILTLVFLPALYVAWFRIHPEETPEAELAVAPAPHP
ncbi:MULTISPECIES: efflux RND transporter permease subunit [unclassified Devosia]|uniref:efflux RND transporter permease subunit n=1 Tax=unclassified Devosia TaxID=196773 RepID=UPI00145DA944|nr:MULTISPECIES: efflux RND transporter permease subunit [unclassified Devosia]MBJ6986793.1 efflux RND transporter permease subunit [Devosia sp. MC521]QMW63828.1 efflux RND transporter permease subunit [Devosia sp. MC521]